MRTPSGAKDWVSTFRGATVWLAGSTTQTTGLPSRSERAASGMTIPLPSAGMSADSVAVMPSRTRGSSGRLTRTANVREVGSALPETSRTTPVNATASSAQKRAASLIAVLEVANLVLRHGDRDFLLAVARHRDHGCAGADDLADLGTDVGDDAGGTRP